MLVLLLALAGCQQTTVQGDAGPVQAPAPAPPTAETPEPAPPPAQVTLPDFSQPPPEPESPGPVAVGLLLPLSGASAELGRAMLDAAQLALFDVGNRDFVLLPRDTRGTPEGAAQAAQVALRDGARLILGPVFGTSVSAVAPLAGLKGVNVVAFSSDSAVARPGVFIMGLLPGQQVERVVAYAASQGIGRVAVLAPANPYGQAVMRAFYDTTTRLGLGFAGSYPYSPDIKAASDVEGVVKELADYDRRHGALLARRQRLEARDDAAARDELAALEARDTLGEVDFDGLLLADGGARLLTVAPLLPYYDVDLDRVRLLGTAQWETADVGREPALVGGWLAAPAPAARRAFEVRFARLYGRPPPRLATFAYDAVALAGALAQRPAGLTAATLTSPDGFRGIDGLFRFTPDGINQRGLAVLEVREDGMAVIDPAPTSFVGF